MLEGIFPVVATPFKENGEIDYEDFKKLLNHLENTTAQGLILLGIASEFYKINDFEKEKLVDLFFEEKNANTKKIIGITDHCTEVAVERAIRYEKKGSDGFMLLPPFFLNPSREQLVYHISKVTESVKVPVMLQYVPRETGCSLTIEDMAGLGHKHTNLSYKIESVDPVVEIKQLLKLHPKANILNGYAGVHMLSVFDIGGAGIIPGCSFTEVYMSIYDLYKSGQKEEAKRLHTELKKYIDIWMGHAEYIIKAEKTILKYRNIIKNDYCRKPCYEESFDLENIRVFCDKFGLSIL